MVTGGRLVSWFRGVQMVYITAGIVTELAGILTVGTAVVTFIQFTVKLALSGLARSPDRPVGVGWHAVGW